LRPIGWPGWARSTRSPLVGAHDTHPLDRATLVRRALVYFGACAGWLLLAHLVGLLPALLPFLVVYLRFAARESWKLTAAISISVWLACYGLFHTVLAVPWPESVLGSVVPELRSVRALAIF